MEEELANVIGVAAPFLVVTVLWLNQWLIKDTFSFEAVFSPVHNPRFGLNLKSSLKTAVQETQITLPLKKSCHIRECYCERLGRSYAGGIPVFKCWTFESSMPTTGADAYSALNKCLLKGNKLIYLSIHSSAYSSNRHSLNTGIKSSGLGTRCFRLQIAPPTSCMHLGKLVSFSEPDVKWGYNSICSHRAVWRLNELVYVSV